MITTIIYVLINNDLTTVSIKFVVRNRKLNCQNFVRYSIKEGGCPGLKESRAESTAGAGMLSGPTMDISRRIYTFTNIF